MNKFVSQSTIDTFFDGKHAGSFSVLGMQTSNGIEVKGIITDAEKVFVLSKETKNVLVVIGR